jgi:hypothetical protein
MESAAISAEQETRVEIMRNRGLTARKKSSCSPNVHLGTYVWTQHRSPTRRLSNVHLGWWYSIIGYAIASYVATSRLHDNQLWLSDVVFAPATGTIAERTVVHHARDHWASLQRRPPGGAIAILVTRNHTAN